MRASHFIVGLIAVSALVAQAFILSTSTASVARAVDRLTAVSDIGPLAKPTMPQVVGAALWGIDFSEVDTKNDQDEALSTTPLEGLDTDLASAEQDERYSQNLYVCNFDSDDNLCVGATTWADTCGAGDMTCMSGATTDGHVVKPDSCRSLRLLGTERPCIQGAAAISSYQVERVTYAGPNF